MDTAVPRLRDAVEAGLAAEAIGVQQEFRSEGHAGLIERQSMATLVYRELEICSPMRTVGTLGGCRYSSSLSIDIGEKSDALGSAFDYLPSARLTSRAGDGDWVPRTEWLDRSGAFAQVPGETILGIAFEDLLGDHVISGIPGPLRPAIVHSAIFSGWLRGAATSTATVRWSEGTVTVTTLRLRQSEAAVARVLGRAMLTAASAS